MDNGENGVLSKAVPPRMEGAKEHEHENVTIPLNPMEARRVSEEILSQKHALPICVVNFHISLLS